MAGMETPGQVHEHLRVLFGLQGEAKKTAHHVVHQACVEVHHLVRGFDPDVGVAEDPLRWGEAAAKLVVLLVDLMSEAVLTVVPPAQTQTMLKPDGLSDDYASTEHYEFARESSRYLRCLSGLTLRQSRKKASRSSFDLDRNDVKICQG